ncbi:MAG TPA: hypothetical protein VG742_07060 [Dongiaceae bacterium]|nr:hypothetical protein [Dongiaceae bacterium]
MSEWGKVKSTIMVLITSAFAVLGIFLLLFPRSTQSSLIGLGVLAFFGSAVPFSLIKLAGAGWRKHAGIIDAPEITRTFARSTVEIAALSFMALGMGIGCYLLLKMGPAKESVRIAAWVGVAMCGLAVIVIPIIAVVRPVRLILSPHGLDYSLFKIGPIEWRDITAVHVGTMLRSEYVAVEVSDPDKYYARGFVRGGRASRWLSDRFPSPFLFIPQQFGANAAAVAEAIRLRLGGAGSPPPPTEPSLDGRREPHF